MNYQATLRTNELNEFLKLFRDCESSKHTQIVIHSQGECDNFKVTLTPTNNCVYLLPSDFCDGLLHIRGWNEKFTRF